MEAGWWWGSSADHSAATTPPRCHRSSGLACCFRASALASSLPQRCLQGPSGETGLDRKCSVGAGGQGVTLVERLARISGGRTISEPRGPRWWARGAERRRGLVYCLSANGTGGRGVFPSTSREGGCSRCVSPWRSCWRRVCIALVGCGESNFVDGPTLCDLPEAHDVFVVREAGVRRVRRAIERSSVSRASQLWAKK